MPAIEYQVKFSPTSASDAGAYKLVELPQELMALVESGSAEAKKYIAHSPEEAAI